MAEAELKRCGLCKKTHRQGEDSQRIRLHAEDLVGAVNPPLPGLYSVCNECFALWAPTVKARVEAWLEKRAALLRTIPPEFGGDAEAKAEAFGHHHYI